MPKIPRSAIRAKFVSGAVLTINDWLDIFDSVLHIDEQTAVDAQVVNQGINAYNNQIMAQTPGDGTVGSLGDVLRVLGGFNDTTTVQAQLNALSAQATWAGLPDKPAMRAMEWNTMIIVTGAWVGTGDIRWLCMGIGGLTGAWIIRDLEIRREAGSQNDKILSVQVGLNPFIRLA